MTEYNIKNINNFIVKVTKLENKFVFIPEIQYSDASQVHF
jgi:hypothetical protein